MEADGPKQAWQIHTSRTGEVAITCREGQYYLVVEPVEGTVWEAEVTEAVLTANAHHTAQLQDRIKELEDECEFARSMLLRAAELGFLDALGEGG